MRRRFLAAVKRIRSLPQNVESFLNGLSYVFGLQPLEAIPAQCDFCPPPPNPAPFRVEALDYPKNPKRLRCCRTCKQLIEGRVPWIINNLRTVHKLEEWRIVTPD